MLVFDSVAQVLLRPVDWDYTQGEPPFIPAMFQLTGAAYEGIAWAIRSVYFAYGLESAGVVVPGAGASKGERFIIDVISNEDMSYGLEVRVYDIEREWVNCRPIESWLVEQVIGA